MIYYDRLERLQERVKELAREQVSSLNRVEEITRLVTKQALEGILPSAEQIEELLLERKMQKHNRKVLEEIKQEMIAAVNAISIG